MPDALDGDLHGRGAAWRAEWRADEDEWTRAAFERWEHSRHLLDVARECMYRGDTIGLTALSRPLHGRVVAVGADTFRIAAGDAIVDVHASRNATFVLRVEARAPTGGTRGDDSRLSFRARLLEHEVADHPVELAVNAPPVALVGALRVGADHVRVIDRAGDANYVPFAAIAWVRAATDD
jgi:hypothetical protein